MGGTAIIITLGCRLNRADEALLTTRLEEAGFQVAAPAPGVEPELVVLNSCCVTAEAERKSRQAARRVRGRWPRARLVVTGCAAELHPDSWRELDALVLTNAEKRELGAFPVRSRHRAMRDSAPAIFEERVWSRFPFRSRAFIKIQEGCDNFCSYCIVPYVRGPERSRAAAEVLADCRQALAAGFPELVLTGVNTCAYRDGERDLGALVEELGREPGNFRIRLSSTEPHPANRKLLAVLARTPKVCPFLHLSLQHGCDRILERMNRHYRAAEFAGFVAEARAQLPDLHLGTDFIVGFPGETERDFAEGLAFAEAQNFANIHIFRYSPRPGTPAASAPDPVPPAVAARRYEALHRVAEAGRRRFADSQLGRVRSVIFEELHADGRIYGWSDNYLRVRAPRGCYPLRELVELELTPDLLVRD